MDTFQTPNLLIVDDDLSLQAVFKYIALNFNLKCRIFGNAEDALESVVNEAEPYTQIYLDWRLPGMSGLDCAKQVRDVYAQRDQTVPIIAVTAYASQSDREECIRLGMDDYLSKPFTVGQFLDMVAHWSQAPDASVHDSEHTGHTTYSSRQT